MLLTVEKCALLMIVFQLNCCHVNKMNQLFTRTLRKACIGPIVYFLITTFILALSLTDGAGYWSLFAVSYLLNTGLIL